MVAPRAEPKEPKPFPWLFAAEMVALAATGLVLSLVTGLGGLFPTAVGFAAVLAMIGWPDAPVKEPPCGVLHRIAALETDYYGTVVSPTAFVHTLDCPHRIDTPLASG
jgi:hypothetical protein